MSDASSSLDPKKRGLGRGLDALFGEDTAEAKAAEISQSFDDSDDSPNQMISDDLKRRTMPIEWLRACEFQPRKHFDDDTLDELASSIGLHGVLQPIVVRPMADAENTYEIIAGERRWRASQRAQLHEVPVIIQYLDDATVLEIALIENLQREDLNAIEEADAYQKLMDGFGHTQEELGIKLGKSRSYIANILRLLTLPVVVRDMVANGDLSVGHARALVGHSQAEDMAQEILAKKLSVRDAENLVKSSQKGKSAGFSRETPDKGVNTLALEEEVSNILGMKVTITAAKAGSGSLKISYKNLDQLDNVLQRLTKKS